MLRFYAIQYVPLSYINVCGIFPLSICNNRDNREETNSTSKESRRASGVFNTIGSFTGEWKIVLSNTYISLEKVSLFKLLYLQKVNNHVWTLNISINFYILIFKLKCLNLIEVSYSLVNTATKGDSSHKNFIVLFL